MKYHREVVYTSIIVYVYSVDSGLIISGLMYFRTGYLSCTNAVSGYSVNHTASLKSEFKIPSRYLCLGRLSFIFMCGNYLAQVKIVPLQ